MGIAQSKGLLRIEHPVSTYLGKKWSRAPTEKESKIEIRHLLAMTSGLNKKLGYECPAGERWAYNTTAYAQTLKVVSKVAEMPPNKLTQEWLANPIGMTDSTWQKRNWGGKDVVAAQIGFVTTARDLARLGLLVLAKGSWNGREIVADKDFFNSSLRPSQKMNPSYGYLWWLNGGSHSRDVRTGNIVAGPLFRESPDDAVAAIGGLGRYVIVVPCLQIVVVRLGDWDTIGSESPFSNVFWRLLMRAAPK